MKRMRWYRFGIELATGSGNRLLVHFWRWTWRAW